MKKTALQPRVFWLSMEWGPYKRGMQPPAPAIARPSKVRHMMYANKPNTPQKPGFFRRLLNLFINFIKKLNDTRSTQNQAQRGANSAQSSPQSKGGQKAGKEGTNPFTRDPEVYPLPSTEVVSEVK